MKRSITAATLILSALFASSLRAAVPISATLSLPNDTVLPGVPFDIVVTYTNVSNHEVTIGGASATLVVTFPNGETKVMHEPEGNDHWSIRGSMPARLAPGESVQHAASWERGSIPNWFRYGSFSGPGTYGIALDLRIADKRTLPLGNIRTPAVTLTRIEPIGIDAELWKRMQEVSGGRWADNNFAATKAGDALASDIIQLYPASGYYPYVLALRAFGRGVEKCNMPPLLEAAERFPESPAHPYLLSAAANCARYAGAMAANAGDAEEAKRFFAVAETKYREALATTSVAIRASTEIGLTEIAWRSERIGKKQRVE